MNTDLVKLFIAKGADVNARNKSGISVLKQAGYTRNADIIAALKAAGAIE